MDDASLSGARPVFSADCLRGHRHGNKRELDDVANRIGATVETLTAYESGRAEPTHETVIALAAELGITEHDLTSTETDRTTNYVRAVIQHSPRLSDADLRTLAVAMRPSRGRGRSATEVA